MLVAVLTRGDDFMVGDLLSEAERAVAIDHWRKSRFPDEAALLHRLELDLEAVGKTSRILENYQRSMSNPSIVAEGLPPSPAVRGMPGPAPRDRGFHSMSLAERAAATGKAIEAQQQERR